MIHSPLIELLKTLAKFLICLISDSLKPLKHNYALRIMNYDDYHLN